MSAARIDGAVHTVRDRIEVFRARGMSATETAAHLGLAADVVRDVWALQDELALQVEKPQSSRHGPPVRAA